MYTPDFWEDSSLGATEASFAGTGEEAADAENGAPAEAGQQDSAHEGGPEGGESGEEPRVLKAFLEGTGSDLFSIETLDYYYGFMLDTASLQLPCSCFDITYAGWELRLPQSEKEDGEDSLIPPYTYEFFDAVPASGNSAGTARNK
ncbi:MAG: hypothetical protein Q4D81_06435, partial [Eubacteriales bacterium]|nr:hypothetical protein [Eubacteriales bacterium]